MTGRVAIMAGLAVLAAATGGCGTAPGAHARWHTGWDKPGMTGEAFERDVQQCDHVAMQVAGSQPGHQAAGTPGARATGPGPLEPLRQAEHRRAYADCMKGKGYTQR